MMRERKPAACPVCGTRSTRRLALVNGCEVVSCEGCGFIHVNPRPSEAELSRLYRDREANPYARESFQPWEREFRTLRKVVRRLRRHAAGGRLLDVGCGSGHLLRLAREAGYAVAGCEPSRVESGPGAFEIRGATLREARWETGSFDIVVMRNVLEHVSEPRAELEEARRVLKGDGLLYLKVPNATFEYGRLCRWIYRQEHAFCPPWHLNYFRPRDLRRLLERSSFQFVGWENEMPTRGCGLLSELFRQTVYHGVGLLRCLSWGRFCESPTLACVAKKSQVRAAVSRQS